jgi:hypothetical protein
MARVAVGAAAAVLAAFGVWFVGFDEFWAVATVLAVSAVGALLAKFRLDDDVPWDPPGRETPRGVRLAVALIEGALAACDRLASPTAVRRARAVVITERDDRLARTTVVRRMRELLTAELHHRGLDPADRTDDAVVALVGPDALTILQPNDSNPVTTAAIARCLDALERLATETQGSR